MGNISTYLDFHMQPLAKQVQSFIQDTDIFEEEKNLPSLPEEFLLLSKDVIGLLQKMIHGERLSST